jgi:hypothetical protein
MFIIDAAGNKCDGKGSLRKKKSGDYYKSHTKLEFCPQLQSIQNETKLKKPLHSIVVSLFES